MQTYQGGLTMHAVIVPEAGRVEIVDVPKPTYGPYECLAEIIRWSICSGTDRHIVDGSFPGAAYPCILGHETIGRVVACGERVRNLSAGDLVLRPVAVRPGETLAEYSSYFGGFAEVGVVADAGAICADTPRGTQPVLPPFATAQQVVPPDFDPDLVGVFITYKETLSSLYSLGVGPGSSLLILGSGPVGLNFTLAAKVIGAYPVIVTGRRKEPLDRALACGADVVINTALEDTAEAARDHTGGAGVEFAVEAIGDWRVLQEGMRALATDGVIGIYGVASERSATLDWSGTAAGLTITRIRPREDEVHQQVLDQLRLGLVDLERQVSHRLPFEEIQAGMELIRQKKATKVVLARDG
jgi:threonine dehydrogenase-like Zn-dependent dehydrogenase